MLILINCAMHRPLPCRKDRRVHCTRHIRVYVFVTHSYWTIFVTSLVAIGSPRTDPALYGTGVFLLMGAAALSILYTLRLYKRIWLAIFCAEAALVLLSVFLLLVAAAGVSTGSFLELLVPVLMAIAILALTRLCLEHIWDVTLFF